MVRNKSHGRHGGNRGQADEDRTQAAKSEAARDSDIESRERNRNEDRAGGHTRGQR